MTNQFGSLDELQRHLRSFENLDERRIAEAAQFLDAAQLPLRHHIVVLLHGMNTNAEWQEALAESIRNSTNIDPRVVGYGNFHPLKFLIPYVFRRGRILKVIADLRGLRASNPEADISIVAHSFGTFIVSKILSSDRTIRFHRILLCGAIVDSDYDWSAAMNQFKEPVINDVGRRDFYPSMAKAWSWGFGDSGTTGFQNSLVRDRYFTYGHSGFLNVRHMSRYWLPFLLDGRVVSSRYSALRKPMRWPEKLRRSFSWKYLLMIAGVVWACARWDIPTRMISLVASYIA